MTEPVPVQFFQSVIAIELAIAGALLFQIRYFQPAARRKPEARDVAVTHCGHRAPEAGAA